MNPIGIRVCLSVLAFFVISDLAGGEELLIQKTGAKYLGWRVERDEFETCRKDRLKVADGKISPTREKCETKVRPPFIFAGGTVQKVDAATGKIEILTQGENVQVSTKDASTKKMASTLKPGDQVDIKYSTAREPAAISIEKKN